MRGEVERLILQARRGRENARKNIGIEELRGGGLSLAQGLR